MPYRNNIITGMVILLATLYCRAKPDGDFPEGKQQQEAYQQQPIQRSSFDKEEWTKRKGKLKIKEYQPEKKKEPEVKKTKNKKQSTAWDFKLSKETSLMLKWTLFALLIGILLFLVLRVLGINPFNRQKDKNKILFSLEDLEDHLDTAAIDPHLYEAIKSGNYKLAIRLYYLMIIQKLALHEKIIWKKYKTNKNYLNEMRQQEDYPVYMELTRIYERCWFGEEAVTRREYDSIHTGFVNYLHNIR